MGETISYSSGKVPESDSLVREAREKKERPAPYKRSNKPGVLLVKEEHLYQLMRHRSALCDALEERERENERWRRVWEAMEGKLEQAPFGEEPLEFWGGYRAALLDMRDFATRARGAKGEVREGVGWLRQALKESQAENERLREACEACAHVVGLITDASAERYAMKKLKEAGFGDY